MQVLPRTACRTLILSALGILPCFGFLRADPENLVSNPDFTQSDGTKPVGYDLEGTAQYRQNLLSPRQDSTVAGVAFDATLASGTVSQTISIDPQQGRSFSFSFRGLLQDQFNVGDDGLYMEVEFFSADGTTSYDGKTKQLFPIIQQARQDLTVNGNSHLGGAAVWNNYTLNFYVPFPQVGRLKLSVVCQGGGRAASGTSSFDASGTSSSVSPLSGPSKPIETAGLDFLVTDFSLTRLPKPTGVAEEAPVAIEPSDNLIPLGGRWFYAAKEGETQAPALFDHTNADLLLYRDGTDGPYEAPFAHNMSATLHVGDKDLAGHIVTADQFVPDNVTVRFDGRSMIIHTHDLPNHPTGRFPEVGVTRGNPNSIQEQDETYYIPLNPQENPSHVALVQGGSTTALNMGPIGIAVNGVVFFNPFDAGQMDASNIMDRCCGHPNQDGMYHYHKYPICLNSPWWDEGKDHSPLIGWAFDGYPIYGPYESANVMAKDITGSNALNAFNMHYDDLRGWHYHVTPGKFPYLIGGYWGQVDARDVRPPSGAHGPPPRGGGFMGGQRRPPPGRRGPPPGPPPEQQ